MSEAILTTRTIGETESALNNLLSKVLENSGLNELGWVALRLVLSMPSPVTSAGLSAQLGGSKKVNAATADSVIVELENQGMLERSDDIVSLTQEGTSLFQRLNGEVSHMTARMWDGLDPADTTAAARVLTTIAQRANDLLWHDVGRPGRLVDS
jgi:DNA-binding MarR family transcriptional regulator